MRLRVNGEDLEVPDDTRTVAGVVRVLGLPPAALLVEHNGVALFRSQWETTLVAEGDRLELLRISAGG